MSKTDSESKEISYPFVTEEVVRRKSPYPYLILNSDFLPSVKTIGHVE